MLVLFFPEGKKISDRLVSMKEANAKFIERKLLKLLCRELSMITRYASADGANME